MDRGVGIPANPIHEFFGRFVRGAIEDVDTLFVYQLSFRIGELAQIENRAGAIFILQESVNRENSLLGTRGRLPERHVGRK